jgi:alpha-L-fucosidase
MSPGHADPGYLNTGDENGLQWLPAETDVSIRPGWFYHPSEDEKVKTPKELVNLYYQSVGRNSLLLLNIPPNRAGRLDETDVENIKQAREILDETFAKNVAIRAASKLLTDKQLTSFIKIKEKGSVIVDFKKPTAIDRGLFQENISRGQKNKKALLQYWKDDKWENLTEFTTIGYKRLLRFPTITTTKLKLTILESKQPVELSEIGFYKASERE